MRLVGGMDHNKPLHELTTTEYAHAMWKHLNHYRLMEHIGHELRATQHVRDGVTVASSLKCDTCNVRVLVGKPSEHA